MLGQSFLRVFGQSRHRVEMHEDCRAERLEKRGVGFTQLSEIPMCPEVSEFSESVGRSR